ncbi:MAG: helix-turn-helix transcriptional regulator [Lewinellaceae bacterium]|nr:helix-turn-helix transcriptional regulator [Lewinellaceae bacterium]
MSSTRDEAYIKAFGLRVKQLRMALGHSQEKFANLCDVEPSQISRIELGKINTSISQAKQIEATLQISMSELFDFKVP